MCVDLQVHVSGKRRSEEKVWTVRDALKTNTHTCTHADWDDVSSL